MLLMTSFALVGSLAVLLAFWSAGIRRAPVSEPLLALLLGVLAGPVTNLVDIPDPAVTGLTLEIGRVLLAISLMAVALRFPVAGYRSVLRPVTVLLTAGMLGMAVLTAGLAWWLLGLPVALAALLGACLTPTDPVLAASVVSGGPAARQLPARLRQVISAESGGNDGLAFTFVVVALAATTGGSWSQRLAEVLWGVFGAALIGLVAGYVAGRAVRGAMSREEVDSGSLLIFALVLAVAVLGVGRLAYTDGILAVFVAGLAYNAVIDSRSRVSQQRLDDSLTRYLVLPLFFLLGAELPWRGWLDLGWAALAFPAAVLLLRRLPVALALHPALRLPWRDTLFLGWFGPIGVSALFYLSYSHEEGVRDPNLWAVGTLVVAASTLVHGVTAMPGRRRYAGLSQPQRRPSARTACDVR
ncbi:cation:proton antiporter [Plantactinospora sp. WMMB334]|uniref:cation:proton antiporter domain-containing protein n=1 Tax=Plantactinospora sp. WMMB334 TaxID=3404119 RepID=UPI003B95E96C